MGEDPHDHPEARVHAPSSYRPEPEYFERGFFFTNDGGTAHEIMCFPIELAESIYAKGNTVSRIDSHGKGFMFVFMDCEHNAKFIDDQEGWDLAKGMDVIEKKINAARVHQDSLRVEVGVCYRAGRGTWYVSTCLMTYRNDLGRITFGPT